MSTETHIDIAFNDVTVGNLPVTPVGENLYRLKASPLVEDAFFHDVIRVTKVSDASYVFEEVVEPSGRKNYCYLISNAVRESPGYRGLLEKIEGNGGYWEQDFGGILVVSLEPSTGLNLPKEITNLKRSLGVE